MRCIGSEDRVEIVEKLCRGCQEAIQDTLDESKELRIEIAHLKSIIRMERELSAGLIKNCQEWAEKYHMERKKNEKMSGL